MEEVILISDLELELLPGWFSQDLVKILVFFSLILSSVMFLSYNLS